MNALVVYYSRTNITKKLAQKIAELAGADTEEITTNVKYDGKIGYARAGKDAISEKIIEISPKNHDPADYDTVYIGTPVWAGKSSTAIISYISENKDRFENVRFFATAGNSGFESTFRQMEKFAGKKAEKTLALTTKEVKKEEYQNKVTEFVK